MPVSLFGGPRAMGLVQAVFDYYRIYQRWPTRVKMHPEYENRLRDEPNTCYIIETAAGGARSFMGVPIEIDRTLHAYKLESELNDD